MTYAERLELVQAVFTAMDLAEELGVDYARDRVAEFAEDLYTEVVEQESTTKV
jgi:hypothetical protein